jgi:hypothetical protein
LGGIYLTSLRAAGAWGTPLLGGSETYDSRITSPQVG